MSANWGETEIKDVPRGWPHSWAPTWHSMGAPWHRTPPHSSTY